MELNFLDLLDRILGPVKLYFYFSIGRAESFTSSNRNELPDQRLNKNIEINIMGNIRSG